MSGGLISKTKAEPNLTPLLDIVFQLITFFMLVINFAGDNYDQRINLPDAGSARPVEDDSRIAEDRLVLNVDSEGRLLRKDRAMGIDEAADEIRHEAALVKLGLQSTGVKFDPASDTLPTTIILRADKETSFGAVLGIIKACQAQGFRKFALKAMIRG
ncbi:biopolymer transporter ExbD [Paludisphaera sp.]|uniref:ExbD/TolR family protein n=1 Tax=Paludisphaera sp. TaxID=2017432 RepID=UPI00301DE0F2